MLSTHSTHPAQAFPGRLSPTSLDCYSACPRQYELRYLDHAQPDDGPAPQLVVGNAIHATLKLFYGGPTGKRSPEELERLLRENWRKHCASDTFASRDSEIVYGHEALRMLADYARTHDLTVEPLGREQWVTLALPNGIVLVGKIDRIDRLNDGVEIIDYKTGRRWLDDEDLPRETAVRVYVLATEARFSVHVERVRFIYLASGEEITWNVEPDDLPAWGDSLCELTDAVRSDEVFATTPGDQCRFCPFALGCTARQATRLNELVPDQHLPF